MLRNKSRLKVLRALADVTQLDVARHAGLSPKRYWEIENGYGNPASKDERDAVALALGVSQSAVAWPEIPQVKAS